MSDAPPPPISLTPDQAQMLEDLQVLGAAIVQHKVHAFAFVALGPEGNLVGAHLTSVADPHRLRGLVWELGDQLREEYIKKPANEPPSGLVLPDGSTAQ